MRKLLIPALFLAACSLQAQTAQIASCKKFVQNFYDWYVTYHGPGEVPALEFRPHSFSASLALQLKEDADAQAKAHEIVGLDFDPFFATNGGENSDRYFVTSAKLNRQHCFAGVHVVPESPDRKGDVVTAELLRINGQWQFMNFHYPANGSVPAYDLLTLLKNLREDRNKPSTK